MFCLDSVTDYFGAASLLSLFLIHPSSSALTYLLQINAFFFDDLKAKKKKKETLVRMYTEKYHMGMAYITSLFRLWRYS